eukprot:314702-Hanusia_phi.AAC.1
MATWEGAMEGCRGSLVQISERGVGGDATAGQVRAPLIVVVVFTVTTKSNEYCPACRSLLAEVVGPRTLAGGRGEGGAGGG